MRKSHISIALLAALTVLLTHFQTRAQESSDVVKTVLSPGEAKLTGSLKVMNKSGMVAIHYWSKTNNIISWVWTVPRPGNYDVALNYALDPKMTGGIISLKVGDQQIVVPAKTTANWLDFHTFEMGIVRVDKTGELPVTLQAPQMPSIKGGAMPDIAWLSLTLTNAP